VDYLRDTWKRHGYFHNALANTVMEGISGLERIRAIQDSLRKSPPADVAGRRVVSFTDHLDPSGRLGPIKSRTDASSRDVLVFALEGAARLILRPSGTEPKNKVYVEVPSPPLGATASDAALDAAITAAAATATEIAREFVRAMLLRVGLDLPAWAVAVSDLVSVDAKVAFAQTTLAALAALGTGESTQGLSARFGDFLASLPTNLRSPDLFLPALKEFAAASGAPALVKALADSRP
jgi:hypothetical protein